MLFLVSMSLASLAIVATVSLVLVLLHRAREGRFVGAVWAPAVVAVLFAPLSYVLSVVVGGSIGGGVGAVLGARLGSAQTSAIIPVGIGVGMWLVGAAPARRCPGDASRTHGLASAPIANLTM